MSNPNENIEDFVNAFLSTLNSEGKHFSSHELASKISHQFWYPRKASFCFGLPWKLLSDSDIRLVKIKNVTENSGFIGFMGNGNEPYLFSFIKEGMDWKLDYFNQAILEAYTATWSRHSSNAGDFRFYTPPTKTQLDFIVDAFSQAQKWIPSRLQTEPLNHLGFYFDIVRPLLMDLFEIKTDQSTKWGGETNDGFILFQGLIPETTLAANHRDHITLRALFLHELVHEYTWYSDEWSYQSGEVSCVQPLLSEGLATYFQMDYLTSEPFGLLDQEDLESIKRFREAIQVSQAYDERILALLDANHFRKLDKLGAYLIGAALIDSLYAKMGISGLKKIWKSFEGGKDSALVEPILLNHISESRLTQGVHQYLGALQKKLDSAVPC